MTDMSDPVFAAALATKLKEECERQHARAEKAEADAQRLTAEVAKRDAALTIIQRHVGDLETRERALVDLIRRIRDAKEQKGRARERHGKRATAWAALREEIDAALTQGEKKEHAPPPRPGDPAGRSGA